MASFDEALQEAYASAPANQVILSTLELNHETMAAPVRLVRDSGVFIEEATDEAGQDIYGHMLTLEDDAPLNPGEEVLFQSVMFSFKLAAQSDARISGMDISIDNATRIISSYLDTAVTVRSPLTVIYREWLSDDLSTPRLIIGSMTIPKVTSTVLNVNCTAEFTDLVNKRFPNKLYRPSEYRGLVA